jgi:transcription elongation GreA/GreB family factor
MSTAEILNELPKLKREERRAIVRRVFELEEEGEDLEWAARAADLAFQELDRLEEKDASPKPR